MNPHDSSNETDELIRQYRQLDDSQQPSPELDDAILSYARASTRRPERWIWPVSVAAALLLTVGLFARMSQLPSPEERSQWQNSPDSIQSEAPVESGVVAEDDSDIERRPESPAIGNSQSMNDSVNDDAASQASRQDRRQNPISAGQAMPASVVNAAPERRHSNERAEKSTDIESNSQDEQEQQLFEYSADSEQLDERRLRMAAVTEPSDEKPDADWLRSVQTACQNNDAEAVRRLMETRKTGDLKSQLSDELRDCIDRLAIDPQSIR